MIVAALCVTQAAVFTCSTHIRVGFPQWLINVNRSLCHLSDSLFLLTHQELWAHWNLIFHPDSISWRHVVACSWHHPGTLSSQPCYFQIHSWEHTQLTWDELLWSSGSRNFLSENNNFQKRGMQCGDQEDMLMWSACSSFTADVVMERHTLVFQMSPEKNNLKEQVKGC